MGLSSTKNEARNQLENHPVIHLKHDRLWRAFSQARPRGGLGQRLPWPPRGQIVLRQQRELWP